MDSGCEYNGYCSDVTRVWPVDGKFNKSQRELYELILEIQKNCIKVHAKLLRNLLKLRIKSVYYFQFFHLIFAVVSSGENVRPVIPRNALVHGEGI